MGSHVSGLFEGSPPVTVGLREFARRIKVTLGAVQKAIKSGRIQAGRRGRDYFIEPIQAEKDWAAHTGQRAKGLHNGKNHKRGSSAKNIEKSFGTGGLAITGAGVEGESEAPRSHDIGEERTQVAAGDVDEIDPGGPIQQKISEGIGHGSPDLGETRKRQNRQTVHDYNLERARREYLEAELAEIRLDEATGKLVNAEKVRQEAFDTYRRFRDTMLKIPDRCAGLLLGQADERTIHNLLTEEIRTALDEFANGQSDIGTADDAARATPAA